MRKWLIRFDIPGRRRVEKVILDDYGTWWHSMEFVEKYIHGEESCRMIEDLKKYLETGEKDERLRVLEVTSLPEDIHELAAEMFFY